MAGDRGPFQRCGISRGPGDAAAEPVERIVHAAGDHHVRLSAADEEVALVVEIAQVTDRDEAIALELRACTGRVVVGLVLGSYEIRPGLARDTACGGNGG